MRLLIFIYFALLLIISPPSLAVYTTMTLEGVKQANGVWSAAGVMDSMGFVRTTGAVTVAGTTASTAVSLAVERNLAKTAFRGTVSKLGPYGLAAVGAYEVYDYLANGDGTSPKLVPCEPSSPVWCHPADASGYDDSYKYGTYYEACTGYNSCSRGSTAREACTNVIAGAGLKITSIDTKNCYLAWASTGAANGYAWYTKSNCTQYVSVASCKFEIDPNKPKPTPISADWFNRLPDPSLPVLADGFNKIPSLRDGGIPISSTKFNPYSEWLGDPYFKDGSWYRDRMDVSPCPTSGQPSRVCVDIGPQKFEGATDPQTVPSQATGTASGTAPKQPEIDFCKKNPQSIACSELGELKDQPFDPIEKPFRITPQSPWGADNAQCPAPKVMTLATGFTQTMSYQPTCDFFSGIRPAVIALAFIVALYIALGIPTGKGD